MDDKTKPAEERLRENQQQIRLLLDSTAKGIFGLDLQGNCTFCNPACARILAMAAPANCSGEACMHSFTTLGLMAPPTYLRNAEFARPFAREKGFTRTPKCSGVLMVAVFRRNTGLIPCAGRGRVIGSVVTFLDVTVRKRTEELPRQSEVRYRALVENATYGTYRSSVGGKFLDLNPALVEMLGYESKAELLAADLGTRVYWNPRERRRLVELYGTAGK